MEPKLEITQKLEDLAEKGELDSSIAILNLPAARYCSRACKGCIARGVQVNPEEELTLDQIKEIIDFFAENYQTKFITINGRGDPFHPEVRRGTLEKIKYGAAKNIRSYVFTAGDNLTEEVCGILSGCGTNVMISLLANPFIDSKFFLGESYTRTQAVVAENVRRLLDFYKQASFPPSDGLTRVGMNYVISEEDLKDDSKVYSLKVTANKENVFFMCNVNFVPHPTKQIELETLAMRHTNHHLFHSTEVAGHCQMGAGSSATVDYNGDLYRCPYMKEGSDGNFFWSSTSEIDDILVGYMEDNENRCVIRKT